MHRSSASVLIRQDERSSGGVGERVNRSTRRAAMRTIPTSAGRGRTIFRNKMPSAGRAPGGTHGAGATSDEDVGRDPRSALHGGLRVPGRLHAGCVRSGEPGRRRGDPRAPLAETPSPRGSRMRAFSPRWPHPEHVLHRYENAHRSSLEIVGDRPRAGRRGDEDRSAAGFASSRLSPHGRSIGIPTRSRSSGAVLDAVGFAAAIFIAASVTCVCPPRSWPRPTAASA